MLRKIVFYLFGFYFMLLTDEVVFLLSILPKGAGGSPVELTTCILLKIIPRASNIGTQYA